MKKILIIGGGFGGIRAALDLDKKLSVKEAEVTLIDRNNYHLFLPSLYEIASAYGMSTIDGQARFKKTVAIPYADIFDGTKVKFVQAEIGKVDLEKREAVTSGGNVFSYDYLILALGSETETFNVPGVTEYAYKFKTVEEAVFLNQKIAAVFSARGGSAFGGEKAQEKKLLAPINFLIIGAGFNGLELGAELACCTENIRRACGLKKTCVSVKLLEAGPQILPMISNYERKKIRCRLAELGVEVLENSPVAEVGPDFVLLKNGEKIPADFIIWTAGIRASSFLKNIENLKLDSKNGKMLVSDFLQVDGRTEVFGLGDSILFVDPKVQKPVPALAYVAVDQGKVAAANIEGLIKNRPLKPYKPFYGVWIAPVGGKYAFAHLGKYLSLHGFWAWALRLVVDFRYLWSILPLSKALVLSKEEITILTKND